LAAAFPFQAFACRDAYPTHEARLDVAEIAFVARVSGVRVPDLERGSINGMNGTLKTVLSPHVVNLVLLQSFKGRPDRVTRVKITQCRGSTYASVGGLVRVYKIHGEWWLGEAPEA
jgi:hypothetical protein